MHLVVSHLRLHLAPEKQLRLPAFNKGNSLRGGFGRSFRKLVCVDLRWDCAECALRFTCPYTKVFNPFLPPDAQRFRGNLNIPRPFVFKPPLSEQTAYAAGEPLVFDLVVVGSAIDYLPYFIVAFRELGVTGFGLNRAPVRLERVEAVFPGAAPNVVYESKSNLVRPSPAQELSLANDAGTREDSVTLTITFLTPTTLKAGSTLERSGEVVRTPAFHHVLKRLRDRINALATFYGNGPLDLDFKSLGELAEQVETVRDDTHWVDRSRYARRRGVTHDLSGFAGAITVRGELAPFLPLLRAGEYVHVGKNAVFGNGWFELQAS